MRKGQNPAKFVNRVAKPERVTVAVLNYIPFMSGFYAQTLDVLKTCLNSIWTATDLPYDLLVFDNGSCQEAIDFLVDAQGKGGIQYLILSEKNLGKGGAWNIILNAAPGEIIAYADNDVYFYPGWLSKSLQILEAFPKTGMVTSRPFRTKIELCTSTLRWAEQTPGVTLSRGQFVSWKDIKAFDMSLGFPEEEVRNLYETTEDVRVTYNGLVAQIGASHWQFLTYKRVVQQFLPFDMDKPMGQVRQLDQRLDEAGYLRLMLTECLVQNMSNRLEWVHSPDEANFQKKAQLSWRKRMVNIPLIKRAMLGIYDRIFRWYYD